MKLAIGKELQSTICNAEFTTANEKQYLIPTTCVVFCVVLGVVRSVVFSCIPVKSINRLERQLSTEESRHKKFVIDFADKLEKSKKNLSEKEIKNSEQQT